MWKQTASLAASIGLVATIACDGTEPGVLDPTPIATRLATSVNIQPSLVTTQSISQPSCPTVPPFVGSLGLTVQAPGDSGVSLRHVQMTFTDTLGASAPAVTLPAPVLTQQFGSTLVEARARRTFPLRFPFGCGTRRTGTVVVIVVLRDDQEQETTAQARVAVR
jgi:hypothetical protein